MTSSSRSGYWKFCSASVLAIAGVIAASGDCAKAQITPDTTLGSENSTVTPIGSVDQINGGATRGANLFHSFQEFNVDIGKSAFFINPPGIENILSRVTGGNPSNILGKLGVSGGNANLFLINPNGIIFGPSSSLSLNGSFIGTTANAIGLTSGDIFSANPGEPLPTRLLNVNPSAFFFNQIAAQPIINRSIARSNSSLASLTGLEVSPSQSLLLVGGDVRLEGGQMQALGGRVELGGLASSGSVSLAIHGSQMSLSFPDGVQRADVYLTNSITNSARVNVAASNGSSIAITARNINIDGNSELSGGIARHSGFSGAQAGNIELNATGAIAIANSFIRNKVELGAFGNSGDINITTGSLSVTNGTLLNTSTRGKGNAGSVNINARDTVSFDGEASTGASSAALSTVEILQAVGNGGDINITTGSLSVTNGAQLAASTRGRGNAGSVNINARDTVTFDGVSRNGFSSRANSSVERDAVEGNGGDINITITDGSLYVRNGALLNSNTRSQGDAGNVNIDARNGTVTFEGLSRNGRPSVAVSAVESTEAVGLGGDINITTGSLALTDGARLTARTSGQGDGGNITLNANTLEAFEGGQVITTSLSSGKAGNITLNVTKSVTLAGSDATYDARLAQFGERVLSDAGPASGLFANTSTNSTNQGGDLRITTGQLVVRDGAQVNVSSLGSGNAGELTVTARDVLLDNQAKLQASTASGAGGNINLQVGDLILMRGNSLISAQADNNGNGGNITINEPLIVAVPSENSDIIANAVLGRGGNINITTQGIYGLEFRDQLTEESDINASSQFGVNGVVEINTPDVDPSRGLTTLSVDLVDASGLIASDCGGGRENQFIITGRGGLPPNPSDTLSSDTVWTDLRPITQIAENQTSSESATQQTLPTAGQVVEAQGWVINNKGEVVLTATALTVKPYILWMKPATCHTP